jgi:acyl-CoA reductase-like NAD-dependent aldehyde dehydrogenase
MYRIAEILEGRRTQFIEEICAQGKSRIEAEQEVNLSIDRIVYYAGWCDKYQAIVSSVNPVASSHFNFSMAEPMGVVGLIAPSDTSLIGLVSLLMPLICGGNTVVVLASEKLPLCAITFSEVLHSSDVPGGVVNILTGSTAELQPTLSSHMDVNAVVVGGNTSELLKAIQEDAALNVKRVFQYDQNWMDEAQQGLHYISDTQEIKTTWHPIEHVGGATSSY